MNNTQFVDEIVEQLKEMVAYHIRSGLRPRYLYKYRSINQGTIENLKNSCLWFACPYQYNDPFDTQLDFEYNYTEESIIAFAEILYNDFKSLKGNFLTDILHEFPNIELLVNNLKTDSKYLHHMADGLMSNIIATTRVCCFSSERNNILMWSHYADYHKGICLEFDTLNDLDFFMISEPMRYVKEYPILSVFNDMEAIVNTSLFAKSSEWQYEREYRVRMDLTPDERDLLLFNTMIKEGNQAVQKHYNPESLRRIIIGCDALQLGATEKVISQIEKLIQEISQTHPHVVYTIAEKKVKEFGLTTDKEISADEILDLIKHLRLAQKRRAEEIKPIFMELYAQKNNNF